MSIMTIGNSFSTPPATGAGAAAVQLSNSIKNLTPDQLQNFQEILGAEGGGAVPLSKITDALGTALSTATSSGPQNNEGFGSAWRNVTPA